MVLAGFSFFFCIGERQRVDCFGRSAPCVRAFDSNASVCLNEMIGSIRGKVLGFEGLSALIECPNGLGYEVEVPANVLGELQVGQECFLYTYHAIREDAEQLYGFTTKEARLLFREVIKINGVGPRVAMALLSTFDLPSFIEVINQGRIASLTAAPGVGKKTAERIVVEMKDRLDKLRFNAKFAQTAASTGKKSAAAAANIRATADVSLLENIDNGGASHDTLNCEDAIAALLSLGYKENVAMSTVKSVFVSGMETEKIIVAALAALSKK